MECEIVCHLVSRSAAQAPTGRRSSGGPHTVLRAPHASRLRAECHAYAFPSDEYLVPCVISVSLLSLVLLALSAVADRGPRPPKNVFVVSC